MSGILNNLASMFRPTQQVVAAPAPMAQVNPGAAAVVPPPGNSNPTPPAGTEPQAPANPLDSFSNIWQTPDNGGNPPADPFAAPLLNSDPNKIAQAASKMDFLSKVPPDVMQKAMSGNDPQAFLQVMNFVGQQSLAAATQLAAATTEHSHQRNNQRMLAALPAQIKNAQVASLTSENPVLQHEAAQPMLKLIRSQIAQSDPNLNPQQIQKRAEEYLTTFASQLAPGSAPAPAPAGSGSQDWDAWVSQQQ